jgi:hypothetical protein
VLNLLPTALDWLDQAQQQVSNFPVKWFLRATPIPAPAALPLSWKKDRDE